MSDTFTQPDPNDQMVDPPLGNEEMEKWLASLGDSELDLPALLTAPINQGEPEPEEEEEPSSPEGDEDEPTPEEESPPDTITVNGQQVPREDLQRLYEFDQFLRSNPDAAARVNSVLTEPPARSPAVSEAPATPAPQEFVAPEPPEGLDLEDPNVKFLWDQQIGLQRSVFNFEQQQAQRFSSIQEFQRRQTEKQAQADMEVALSQFREQFTGLNDDDIAQIRQQAVPYVPTMMQQNQPVEALRRSMEVAGWANKDMREKMSQPVAEPTEHQRSTHRKRRMGQISGSSRSAPKTESRPVYTSDRDMINTIAHEIADSLGTR